MQSHFVPRTGNNPPFQRTPASPLIVADRSSSKSPPLIESRRAPFRNLTGRGRKVEVIFVSSFAARTSVIQQNQCYPGCVAVILPPLKDDIKRLPPILLDIVDYRFIVLIHHSASLVELFIKLEKSLSF
ncbi:hypothetical protein CEXT_372201 [Caerostris extrusa]|uniref:Uncharacterized protein n=1 Tax=Caerostris extrusa TaxID=172846 RepID=A0AAV4Q7M5_CAEEX|nr:hypothetical protein CEXT_372201 [Caerostris extrusa]